MTTLAGTVGALLPERIKAPLRRYPGVFSPTKLMRTVLYQAGLYRLFRRRVRGLHLGCGDLIILGFWNIDAMFATQCDVVACVERLKLADQSVGTIYCAHVFEHLSRNAAPLALRQWQRVLEPGGKLYLACPDLEALARLYLANLDDLDTPERRRRLDLLQGVIYGGQDTRYNFHGSGWSFTTLSLLLQEVGFKSVQRFDTHNLALRPFRDASFAALDGTSISLNVEATK